MADTRPAPRLSLIAGLAVSAFATLSFAGLLAAILRGTPIARWDAAGAAWVHAHVTTTGLRLFEAVSLLGSPVAWLIAGSAVVWLAIRRDYALPGTWLRLQAGLEQLTAAERGDRIDPMACPLGKLKEWPVEERRSVRWPGPLHRRVMAYWPTR